MKTKTKQVTLPDKPSELIRLALTDLVKCERSPKYVIEMASWHHPWNGKCEVCLAGAVMAKTLNMDATSFISPNQTNYSAQLKALNLFRIGGVTTGLEKLEIDIPDSIKAYQYIADYDEDPKQFKADMRKLANDLEAAGL